MIAKPVAYAIGAALLASLAFGGAQCSQKQSASLKAADAEAKLSAYEAQVSAERARFEIEARQTEQRHAADMTRIERETQDRLKEAGTDAYNRAVADVRAGRLRNVWSCPATAQVPGPVGPAAERDGGASDRVEAIGRVLRIGAEADIRLAACQAVIQADRKTP